MANMPRTIRVGPFDYTVKQWSGMASSNAGNWGLCDRCTLTILVAEGLHPMREAEVLLHEVLHAAYDTGHAGATEGEEAMVSTLGYQLSQVIRDNPDLMRYFEEVYRPTTHKGPGRSSRGVI